MCSQCYSMAVHGAGCLQCIVRIVGDILCLYQIQHVRMCLIADNKQLSRREDEEETKGDPSRWVSELEHCLLEVLSDVLEAEMKVAYGDLWLEVNLGISPHDGTIFELL